MRHANHLSWGLFRLRGARLWRNIKDIPIFIDRIFFTLKHGYSTQARWETFPWFIDTMREILTWHRYHRMGTGYILDEPLNLDSVEQDERNINAYNDGLDRMTELLDRMDENSALFEEMKAEAAKDEFFKLFSKYFYYLWD